MNGYAESTSLATNVETAATEPRGKRLGAARCEERSGESGGTVLQKLAGAARTRIWSQLSGCAAGPTTEARLKSERAAATVAAGCCGGRLRGGRTNPPVFFARARARAR
eukprot:gene9210-biopygen15230